MHLIELSLLAITLEVLKRMVFNVEMLEDVGMRKHLTILKKVSVLVTFLHHNCVYCSNGCDNEKCGHQIDFPKRIIYLMNNSMQTEPFLWSTNGISFYTCTELLGNSSWQEVKGLEHNHTFLN